MPVPRPTVTAGGAPVSAQASAAVVVVLPIPISPSDEAVDTAVGELAREAARRSASAAVDLVGR